MTSERPALSTRSAANLYIRITGAAHFDVDPVWELDDPLRSVARAPGPAGV